MSGPRVLIVEDERKVRRPTALALEAEGYTTLEAADADAAMAIMDARHPDLVILDVMLPGRDGFELCREIRKESDIPIVFVTAKTDTVDVVVGLESGGDDYLTKPFVTRELIARIRALLRRVRSGAQPQRFVAGDVEIQPDAGTVLKRGVPCRVTKTEFELLCCLAERPGWVFTREVLLERVWGYDYLGDSRLVDVHVRRLRTKVEDDPSDPRLIQTVRGLGYRLAAS